MALCVAGDEALAKEERHHAMIDQEAKDVAASVEHLLTQRGTDARNWQRQAEAHEATLIDLRKEITALIRLVGTETPIAAFDLATTWKATEAHLWDEIAELRQQLAVAAEDAGIARTERDEARAEIDQARGILCATDAETLAKAAQWLVEEEETARETADKFHTMYWTELMPLARALVASLHGDGNGRCWCGAREADELRGYLERDASRAREEG